MAETPCTKEAGQRHPSGRAMVNGGQCLCGSEIKASDLVLADFDVKDVSTGGGLYLLQATDSPWHGCRRMMRVPAGIAIDQDGHGDWITVSNMDGLRWQIIGAVETVYRPTRNL